ncbi:MAG: hypothetical protein KKD59_02775 [Acidobacteria bacterium]|nr:hypothetical protein [Acidobacteriota bacterium]
MKELFMADDVLGILLKNRVYAVVRVEFPHQYTQLKKKTGVNMTTPFSVVSMDVSLETDLAQINKILQDLAARDIIYNVKKITMKRNTKDSDHVTADSMPDVINIKFFDIFLKTDVMLSTIIPDHEDNADVFGGKRPASGRRPFYVLCFFGT